MRQIQVFGHIDQGTLVFYNRNVFAQQVKEIGTVNHAIFTLEYGNKRTPDQNAYLWGGVINPIHVRYRQEGWEYTPEEIYRILENTFSVKEVVNSNTGEISSIVEPLKQLTTEQWDEVVMQRIRGFAEKDLGIYIKTPPEYYGISEGAYTEWKEGRISLEEAKAMNVPPEIIDAV